MATEPGRILIDGRRYAWRSTGSGPPLILVNGYAASGADWDREFVSALAPDFTLLCPDNRGVGGSERGDGELTIEAMAADVEQLMDHLELETAGICGWSMGGYVVQALAERASDRVSSLTLIGTHPGGPAYVPTGDAEAFANLIDYSGTPEEQARRLISVFFTPEEAAAAEARLGDEYAAARARLDHRTLDDQVAALLAWRDREPPQLASRPPVLVLHGARDRLVSSGNATPLASRWAAKVEIFEESAHAAMTQEPARAASAIASLAA
ncbi:MAG: alpha/beta fold hydrolase [Solirubrobacterales bacterium]